MSRNFPELDEMHEEFMRILASDPSPVSNLTLLWHEALEMDRNPAAPSARTRGGAFLMYYNETGLKPLAEVPGRQFAQDKLPHRTCTALISRNAASMDGPRSITFRYARGTDGQWAGGYSIETSQEYKDLVLGRKEIDARMTEALRAHWAPEVTRVALVYGPPTWTDPVPKLKIAREAVEFVDLDDTTRAVWEELVAYLRSRGQSHIYYADMHLHRANAKLREGDNLELRYSR
jgi:hypothetical protein